MHREVYRYTFHGKVPLAEIEAALVLAIFACESLHGEVPVQLEVAHFLDMAKRACVTDASGQVARDFNKLFAGFLRREFGADAFQVERVSRPAEVGASHK